VASRRVCFTAIGLRAFYPCHWSNESIAAAWDVGDEPCAVPAIAQHLPQGSDMHAKRRFVDMGFGPGAGYQLVLADYVSGSLDQCDQQVEGSTAKPHWSVIFEQRPRRRHKPERTERETFVRHRIAPRRWPAD
ncbi:MAG TPA: hypothetical protein VE218_09615, partial [Acidobacteriaceae bacterium]|nr:hypothetical protein [Acidobacteriaceae bacterium]